MAESPKTLVPKYSEILCLGGLTSTLGRFITASMELKRIAFGVYRVFLIDGAKVWVNYEIVNGQFTFWVQNRQNLTSKRTK
jgi:hypothetical protein